MKNKVIVLANSPINDGNKGCVALTISSIFIIDKIFSDNNNAYDLYILDSYLKGNGKRVVDIFEKKICFTTISYPYGFGWKEIIKSVLYLKYTIKSILVLRRCDYILDLGRGDSFSDIYGKRRFYMTDRIHVLARFFKKPYAFLPQTIGPFSDNKIKKSVRQSLLNSQLVMVRDFMSYEFVKNVVPELKNVREYIDVAFFLPYKKNEYEAGKVHVGLNVSSLLWRGGYTGDDQFSLKEEYSTVIRSIIDYFLNHEEVIIHLVPHVVGKDNIKAADTIVSENLIKEYNNTRIILAPHFNDPISAKSYISGLDFFMGSRMHSTIAAFSSGVPVVPIAYSRKFNGLFKGTLNYDNMVDLKNDNLSEIMDTISKSFVNRSYLKQIISNCECIIKERKEIIFRDLSQFFNIQ